MARKFEDEVTVIKVFTPNQDKMLEALNYVLNIKSPNKDKNNNELSAIRAAVIKAKLNSHHNSSFLNDDR